MIINNRWRDAGLDDPVVEERMGSGAPDRTMLKLPLTSTYITSPVTGDEESDIAGDEDKKKRILAFCKEPRSKAEIQEHLGIKSERYVRQKLMIPLLSEGCLVRTIPDKPSSPKQKYITVSKCGDQ